MKSIPELMLTVSRLKGHPVTELPDSFDFVVCAEGMRFLPNDTVLEIASDIQELEERLLGAGYCVTMTPTEETFATQWCFTKVRPVGRGEKVVVTAEVINAKEG